MANKTILAFTAVCLLFACKSAPSYSKVNPLTNCAVDFKCSETLHKNASLEFKMAEYGNATATIVEQQESLVVELTKDKIVEKGIQDANYREHFLIQLADPKKTVGVSAVQKFVFGKFCYCKGEAGYFEVTDFEVSYTSNGKVGRYVITYSVPNSKIQKQKIEFELR
ncbi:hypothetical protein [Flavobacterium sp.]|uniref:hypothetical protein n=1 Tax=Flavobacterium sp. TaxID=239 RepID=UPI00260FFF46|nr:hypothetical protein [Flavobacterium sp.]